MRTAQPKADSEQHRGSRRANLPTSFAPGRHALGAVTLAGTLLAGAPLQAQTAVEDRINAAFALFEYSVVLTMPPWPDPGRELEVPLEERPLLEQGPAIDEIEQGAAEDLELARLPRSRPEDPIITGSIVTPDSTPPDASVPEVDFFGRFAGSFAGAGQVQRNANESPNEVQCTLTGKPSANGVSIAGKCGTFIFSRRIRAEITYDAASGRYSGVYVGAKVGPAKLSGKRRGDAVVLTITWPKPVNGDTQATMAIRNSGNGQLVVTVTDELQPGGPKTEVTRLALNQT